MLNIGPRFHARFHRAHAAQLKGDRTLDLKSLEGICSKIIYASFKRRLRKMLTENLVGLVRDTDISPADALQFLKVMVPTAMQEVLATLELPKQAPTQTTSSVSSEPIPEEPPRVRPPVAETSQDPKTAGIPDVIDTMLQDFERAGMTIVEALHRGVDAVTPTQETRRRIEEFGTRIQAGVDSILSRFQKTDFGESTPPATSAGPSPASPPADKNNPPSPPPDPHVN